MVFVVFGLYLQVFGYLIFFEEYLFIIIRIKDKFIKVLSILLSQHNLFDLIVEINLFLNIFYIFLFLDNIILEILKFQFNLIKDFKFIYITL